MVCAFLPRFKADLVPQLQKAVREEILQVELARVAVARVPLSSSAACPPTRGQDDMLLPLLPLLAALDAPAEPPLLGRLFQARVDVHEMSRAELAEALSERGVQYSVHDSEDVLRIRLYRARAALLDSRSAHLAHAERVMNEATEHSTFAFLSGNTLDTSLTLP